MRRVCFYITTRGNYAKTKTIIDNLRDKVEIQYIVGLDCPKMEFYGVPFDMTPFPDAATVAHETDTYFRTAHPDLFVVIADRWECLPAAMSAYYLNIPIAHLEGGEVSRAVDNGIRNAITQLATLHFPCTKNAMNRIYDMGIETGVYLAGSTSFDMLRLYKDKPISAEKPYIVVTLHGGSSPHAIKALFLNMLWVLSSLKIETYWIRPNIDDNSDMLNSLLDKIKWPFIHVTDSMRIEEYAPLMANAACIVGNSSTGIREASFLGTPAVNVGDRQTGRERYDHVIDAMSGSEVKEGIEKQVAHGPYSPDYTYGDGHAGEKVADVILEWLGAREVVNAA